MGQMIRSKRKWVCSKCKKEYIKWSGICTFCGGIGTLDEVKLIPDKPRARPSQKALGARSKRSERTIARRMVDIDGEDPAFRGIASSTGRTGHITNMRVDAVSKNHRTENKNRVMPKWFIEAWLLINQRATDYDKKPLLHLDPPNMPKSYPLNGERHKLDTIACIPQERYEHLIILERAFENITDVLNSDVSLEEKAQKIDKIIRF